jgi:hypothetical protein
MKMKGNYTERTSAENIQLEVLDLTFIKLVYVPEDRKILHKNPPIKNIKRFPELGTYFFVR